MGLSGPHQLLGEALKVEEKKTQTGTPLNLRLKKGLVRSPRRKKEKGKKGTLYLDRKGDTESDGADTLM